MNMQKKKKPLLASANETVERKQRSRWILPRRHDYYGIFFDKFEGKLSGSHNPE